MIKRYIAWRIKRLESVEDKSIKQIQKLRKLKTTRDWQRFGKLKFGEDITHEPRSMNDVREAMAEQWKQEKAEKERIYPPTGPAKPSHDKILFEDAEGTRGVIIPYVNGKPLKAMEFGPDYNYDGSENKDSLKNVRKRIDGIRKQANGITG